MKRILSLLLILCLLVPACVLATESATDSIRKSVIEANAPGDVSAVLESDGRIVGPVYGVNAETGVRGESLYVDAPLPADFTEEQRVLITASFLEIDKDLLTDALLATGVKHSNIFLDHNCAYNTDLGITLPAPDTLLTHEQASTIAQRFVADCGLGETRVLFALRPEEEASRIAAQEAPEAQEAIVQRTLREWYRADTRYTSVRLLFTLRGLPVGETWMDADNVCNSSVANLFVGDAGEIRDFSLWYAPSEVSAAPYAGELKTWQEALAEFSASYSPYNGEPRTDARGRETPPLRDTVTQILPAYGSRDGKTFVPCWLFVTDTLALGDGDPVPSGYIWATAIDARVGY